MLSESVWSVISLGTEFSGDVSPFCSSFTSSLLEAVSDEGFWTSTISAVFTVPSSLCLSLLFSLDSFSEISFISSELSSSEPSELSESFFSSLDSFSETSSSSPKSSLIIISPFVSLMLSESVWSVISLGTEFSGDVSPFCSSFTSSLLEAVSDELSPLSRACAPLVSSLFSCSSSFEVSGSCIFSKSLTLYILSQYFPVTKITPSSSDTDIPLNTPAWSCILSFLGYSVEKSYSFSQ